MICARLGRLYKGLKSIYINSKGSLAQWWRICLPKEEMQVMGSIPGWEIPWRRKWQSAPALLPGKSLGQRSLASYSPCGWEKLDTTERLSTQAREAASEYFSIENILGFHCYTSYNSFWGRSTWKLFLPTKTRGCKSLQLPEHGMYACRLERERTQDPQRAGLLCVSVVLFGLVGDASDLGWTWAHVWGFVHPTEMTVSNLAPPNTQWNTTNDFSATNLVA